MPKDLLGLDVAGKRQRLGGELSLGLGERDEQGQPGQQQVGRPDKARVSEGGVVPHPLTLP